MRASVVSGPQPRQSDEERAREALARGRMDTWPGYTTDTTWENTDQQNRDHWLSMIWDNDVRSVAAFAASVRAEATLAANAAQAAEIADKDGEVEQARHVAAIAEFNEKAALEHIAAQAAEIAALREELKDIEKYADTWLRLGEHQAFGDIGLRARAALEMSGGSNG